jgi:hypothetical protein
MDADSDELELLTYPEDAELLAVTSLNVQAPMDVRVFNVMHLLFSPSNSSGCY